MMPPKTARPADPALDRLEREPRDHPADPGRSHQQAKPARPDPEFGGGDREHEGIGQPDATGRDRHQHQDAEGRIGGGIADGLDEWPDDRRPRPIRGLVRQIEPEPGHGQDRGGEQGRGDGEGDGR